MSTETTLTVGLPHCPSEDSHSSFTWQDPTKIQTKRASAQDGINVPRTPDEMAQARKVILKATQKPALAKELSALHANKTIPKNSPLRTLNPILEDDLICVGGRLKHSSCYSREEPNSSVQRKPHFPTAHTASP